MKKLTSLLLALMMVVSLFSTFVVFTSAAGNDLLKTYENAADGDVLYKAQFGKTDGAYKSSVWALKNVDDLTNNQAIITTSADASEIEIKWLARSADNSKDESRIFYYGGAVEGLTIEEGKKYTLEYYVKLPDVDTGSGQNFGVYINHPTSFGEEGAPVNPATDPQKVTEQNDIYGWYGTPYKRHTLTKGGSKCQGDFVSNRSAYVTDAETLIDPIADGAYKDYYKIQLEVDGLSYKVFINGKYFDGTTLHKNQIKDSNAIGINLYLYNRNVKLDAANQAASDGIKVKDVTIYKGTLASPTATYPSYYKTNTSTGPSTNQLLKTYEAAADGDVLYNFKMDATDGVFVPHVIAKAVDVAVINDETSVEYINMGTAGQYWWGDVVDGLYVTADTKYTYSFEVQNKVYANGGVGFVSVDNSLAEKCFNFYGQFNQIEGNNKEAQTVIELDSAKIKGELLNTQNYTPIYPKLNDEGFTQVKVEIDGYQFTVYYLTTAYGIQDVDPYWAVFETYNMEEDLADRDTAQIAFVTYTHNANTNWVARNVSVQKGLTVDKSTHPDNNQNQTTEAPTTDAATTDAPTTVEQTTEDPQQTTEAPKEEKGCGGMIGTGLAVIAIVSLGAVAISKKRD